MEAGIQGESVLQNEGGADMSQRSGEGGGGVSRSGGGRGGGRQTGGAADVGYAGGRENIYEQRPEDVRGKRGFCYKPFKVLRLLLL